MRKTEGSIQTRISDLKGALELLQIRKDLKTKGDLHIVNCYLFFQKWIEKSDPLRDLLKALVFGVIYGKSIRSLARDLRKQRVMELATKIHKLEKELDGLSAKSDEASEARKLEVASEMKKAKADLTEAEERDWEDFAGEVADKLFTNFPDGKAFLDNAVAQVSTYGNIMSPIGRIRRLWRVFTGKRGVISAAGRRAQNSPIQGLASETGCSSAYLILKAAYDWILDHGMPLSDMPLYNRAVHDCNVFQEPYAMVIPMLHIKSFMATTGAANWYKETFGLEWTVVPEIEMEYFTTEDKSYKRNWEIPCVLKDIRKCLQEQRDFGDFESDEEMEEAWNTVMMPWKDPDLRKELCTRFPVLDVDIEPVVVKELSLFEKQLRKDREKAHAA